MRSGRTVAKSYILIGVCTQTKEAATYFFFNFGTDCLRLSGTDGEVCWLTTFFATFVLPIDRLGSEQSALKVPEVVKKRRKLWDFFGTLTTMYW